MRLIDADAIKQKYRDKLIKNLIDKDRGIDLSEYAKEPSKSFNRFIDEMPTVDALDKIRAEIRKKMRFDSFNEGIVSFDDISKIFDKYKTESEE